MDGGCVAAEWWFAPTLRAFSGRCSALRRSCSPTGSKGQARPRRARLTLESIAFALVAPARREAVVDDAADPAEPGERPVARFGHDPGG